jgi:hypothetical protein
MPKYPLHHTALQADRELRWAADVAFLLQDYPTAVIHYGKLLDRLKVLPTPFTTAENSGLRCDWQLQGVLEFGYVGVCP